MFSLIEELQRQIYLLWVSYSLLWLEWLHLSQMEIQRQRESYLNVTRFHLSCYGRQIPSFRSSQYETFGQFDLSQTCVQLVFHLFWDLQLWLCAWQTQRDGKWMGEHRIAATVERFLCLLWSGVLAGYSFD